MVSVSCGLWCWLLLLASVVWAGVRGVWGEAFGIFSGLLGLGLNEKGAAGERQFYRPN